MYSEFLRIFFVIHPIETYFSGSLSNVRLQPGAQK